MVQEDNLGDKDFLPLSETEQQEREVRLEELRLFKCSEEDDIAADIGRYATLAGERADSFEDTEGSELLETLIKAKNTLKEAASSKDPELQQAKIDALEAIIKHYLPLLLSAKDIEDEKRRL
jgi:hypothetical protein